MLGVGRMVNLRSGQRTYTWSDGGKYIGDWKDGKPWNGKSYDKDGKYKWKYVNGK